MKIVFMGTPDIAVGTLESLYNLNYDIQLVITREDKPKGRGKELSITPVKEFALSKGLKIYQPNKLRGNDEAISILKDLAPDFFVVVAYGRILPKEILDIPKIAPVNLHFSLLPKYRGAAPVNWAIFNGEIETGVSTMLMDEGMDTGDILLQEKILVGNKTSHDISNELAIIGAELTVKTLDDFNNLVSIKQDDSNTTLAPIIKKEDGIINWNRNAVDIERQIRAFYGWPSAYSSLNDKMIKISKAVVVTDILSNGRVGEIIDIDKNSFTVGTNDYGLKILNLQPEGKKSMDALSFLSGNKLKLGDRFVQ